jgi:hypothetical protein
VTWYTARVPRAGIAHLTLNGAPLDEVDLYSPSAVAQEPRTYTDLGPGPHLLAVSVTGRRHPEAQGSVIVVDAFVAAEARPAPERPSRPASWRRRPSRRPRRPRPWPPLHRYSFC